MLIFFNEIRNFFVSSTKQKCAENKNLTRNKILFALIGKTNYGFRTWKIKRGCRLNHRPHVKLLKLGVFYQNILVNTGCKISNLFIMFFYSWH